MPAWIVLILIWLLFSLGSGKKKKAPKQGPGPLTGAKAAANAEARAAARQAMLARHAKLAQKTAAPEKAAKAAPQPAPKPAPARMVLPKQGESFRDDDGCQVGSLGGHHAEGESAQEHAEHLRRADETNAAQAGAQALRGGGLPELRRAIVLSEILDRPKALRRR